MSAVRKGKGNALSELFISMVQDEARVVTLTFGSGPTQTVGANSPTARVSINPSNTSNPYGTEIVIPNLWCTTPHPDAKFTVRSMVAHELGHVSAAWRSLSPWTGEDAAVAWENTVYAAQGRPARNYACHFRTPSLWMNLWASTVLAH
jgi:hypothetical protein